MFPLKAGQLKKKLRKTGDKNEGGASQKLNGKNRTS